MYHLYLAAYPQMACLKFLPFAWNSRNKLIIFKPSMALMQFFLIISVKPMNFMSSKYINTIFVPFFQKKTFFFSNSNIGINQRI